MTQHSRLIDPGTPGGVPPRTPFRFTGWHMFAILIAFFGVVIVVNVYMARLAVSTFSGEVVENSYEASQLFNKWLDQAHSEEAYGWKAAVARSGDRLTLTLTDASGRPLAATKVIGLVVPPIAGPAQPVIFVPQAPAPRSIDNVGVNGAGQGVFVAHLAPGRWQLHLEITAEGHKWHKVEDLPGTTQ